MILTLFITVAEACPPILRSSSAGGVNADSICERRAKTKKNNDLDRVVDFLVGGVGPERVVPDGALHLSEEGLYLAAVLLSVGFVEGEGHEEAAGPKLTAG